LNVTVPVGVPALLVTVAVNVTACPTLLGLTEDVSVAAVAAAPTVWVNADEMLAEKLASPP
jgi:predicted small secreted protein